MALLFSEQSGIIFVIVLVSVENYMLRGRNQAVLYAPEPAERLLISPRMEKSYILRIVPQFGQEHRILMCLGVVVILAVAGEAAQENPLILSVPVV